MKVLFLKYLFQSGSCFFPVKIEFGTRKSLSISWLERSLALVLILTGLVACQKQDNDKATEAKPPPISGKTVEPQKEPEPVLPEPLGPPDSPKENEVTETGGKNENAPERFEVKPPEETLLRVPVLEAPVRALIVKHENVTCEKPDECPEFVGLLVGNLGHEDFHCSVTYVGQGYFSTSRRCFPSSFEPSVGHNQSCEGTIRVLMPATAAVPAETFNCEQINGISDKGISENSVDSLPQATRDIVLFHVKEAVNRKANSIDWSSTPKLNEVLTFWPAELDSEQTGVYGIIRQKKCRVVDHQLLQEQLDIEGIHYPLSKLASCSSKIDETNLGSTLMNSSGSGVSILNDMAGATSNFACLGARILEGDSAYLESSSRCSVLSEQEKTDLRKRAVARIANEDHHHYVQVQTFLRALWRQYERRQNEISAQRDLTVLSEDLAKLFSNSEVSRLTGTFQTVGAIKIVDDSTYALSYLRRDGVDERFGSLVMGPLLQVHEHESVLLPACIKSRIQRPQGLPAGQDIRIILPIQSKAVTRLEIQPTRLDLDYPENTTIGGLPELKPLASQVEVVLSVDRKSWGGTMTPQGHKEILRVQARILDSKGQPLKQNLVDADPLLKAIVSHLRNLPVCH